MFKYSRNLYFQVCVPRVYLLPKTVSLANPTTVLQLKTRNEVLFESESTHWVLKTKLRWNRASKDFERYYILGISWKDL